MWLKNNSADLLNHPFQPWFSSPVCHKSQTWCDLLPLCCRLWLQACNLFFVFFRPLVQTFYVCQPQSGVWVDNGSQNEQKKNIKENSTSVWIYREHCSTTPDLEKHISRTPWWIQYCIQHYYGGKHIVSHAHIIKKTQMPVMF